MQNKFEDVKLYLENLKKQGLCLAFSGGIDSALLLYLCQDLNITAVTFMSVFQTEEEIDFTKSFCKKYGVPHEIIEFAPLEDAVLKNNPKDRCYLCKKLIFTKLRNCAAGKVIIDGTNFDDLNVYRPGLKALKELGVLSPFAEFKITKKEIRDYAKNCGIEIFDKPSTPCLATRFPYGTELLEERITLAARGERVLRNAGFENCRLRLHGDIARIEISPERFAEFIGKKDCITETLKASGIKYVTLDVEGLRSGSMD